LLQGFSEIKSEKGKSLVSSIRRSEVFDKLPKNIKQDISALPTEEKNPVDKVFILYNNKLEYSENNGTYSVQSRARHSAIDPLKRLLAQNKFHFGPTSPLRK
jgi:hypothetical protein